MVLLILYRFKKKKEKNSDNEIGKTEREKKKILMQSTSITSFAFNLFSGCMLVFIYTLIIIFVSISGACKSHVMH